MWTLCNKFNYTVLLWLQGAAVQRCGKALYLHKDFLPLPVCMHMEIHKREKLNPVCTLNFNTIMGAHNDQQTKKDGRRNTNRLFNLPWIIVSNALYFIGNYYQCRVQIPLDIVWPALLESLDSCHLKLVIACTCSQCLLSVQASWLCVTT